MRAGVEFVVAATNELSVRCKVIQRNSVKCQSRCWVGHKTAGVCASFVHLIFYWESQIRNYKWPLISEFVYQCDTKQQITLCLPTFVFMPKSRIKNWKKNKPQAQIWLWYLMSTISVTRKLLTMTKFFMGLAAVMLFLFFHFLKVASSFNHFLLLLWSWWIELNEN